MSDLINFDVQPTGENTYSRIIHARRLLAFLPQQGFLAFEGYGYIPKENLPIVVQVNRFSSSVPGQGTQFHIRILESYKKDIQEPMTVIETAPEPPTEATKQEDEDDDDEFGGGSIQFFPTDLMLYRFEVIDCLYRHYPDYDFRYCIDDRFPSLSDMIERYLSLLDLPEMDYDWYESKQEDKEFYVGYHAIKEKNVNMFEEADAGKFIPWDSTTPIEPTVSATIPIPVTTRSHEDMERVIEQWATLYHQANQRISPSFGNKQFLDHSHTFLTFIQDSLPTIQRWCASYLCESTLQEKLRGWLTYAIHSVRKGSPIESFEKHWKLFFRTSDSSDLIQLGGNEYDISYRNYLEIRRTVKEEKDISFCTDPDILAIHKDKPCDHWMCCFLCEEMSDQWTKKVDDQYKDCKNIFYSKEIGDDFIVSWLQSVATLSEKEQARIHYQWPVIPTYHQIYPKTVTMEEYVAYLLKERYERYYTYRGRPKVEFEFIRDLNDSIYEYRLPHWERHHPNYWNEVFLFFLRFSRYVYPLIYMDLKRCKEVTEVFDKLPDE